MPTKLHDHTIVELVASRPRTADEIAVALKQNPRTTRLHIGKMVANGQLRVKYLSSDLRKPLYGVWG